MQKLVVSFATRVLRVVSLVILSVIGTYALVRIAPGYFADTREMDAQHGAIARSELSARQTAEASFSGSLWAQLTAWGKGDLGRSRQYDVPVLQLLRDRTVPTAKLLGKSIFLGWSLSFAVAVLLSARRKRGGECLVALSSAALLCVPIALLATICLVLNWGGPVFVLAALIAVRDFKLLYRLLSNGVRTPAMFYARAQGYSFAHAVRTHLLRALRAEFIALLMASLVIALSAVVPVEVIFDQPGLGQLAWSSAMNRDLATLLPITFLIAAAVGIASILADSSAAQEMSACA